MKQRAALIHHLNKLKIQFPREFADVDINDVKLYLDIANADDIINIIDTDKNKFRLIVLEMLKGSYNPLLYRKEGESVTAMKFKGPNHNSRIYCLETKGVGIEKKRVVMAKGLWNKTSQKNNKTNNPIIESIQKYKYEYFNSIQEAKGFGKKD